MPSLRLEIFVVLVVITRGNAKLSYQDPISRIFAYLTVVACVAIASSYTLFDTPFNYSDFMILPMLAQYWLIYCFARSLQDPRLRLHAVKMTAIFVGVSAVVGIFQKLNLVGVNSWLTPHFIYAIGKERTLQGLTSGADWGRVVGTVGDPRHYACVLSVGMGAVFALLLYQKSSNVAWQYPFLALTILVAEFFAASRTGLVAMFLILLVGLYLQQASSRKIAEYLLVACLVAPILFGVWESVAPNATKERLLSADSQSFDNSMHARSRDFLEPFKEGLKEPLIFITGRGPSKSILPGSEHTDMGWMALRYGLLGLSCYLALFYKSWKQAVKRYQSGYFVEEKAVAMFAAMAIGVWFLFAQAESIFKLGQLMSLNMLVLGLVFAKPFYPRRRNGLRSQPKKSTNRTLRAHQKIKSYCSKAKGAPDTES